MSILQKLFNYLKIREEAVKPEAGDIAKIDPLSEGLEWLYEHFNLQDDRCPRDPHFSLTRWPSKAFIDHFEPSFFGEYINPEIFKS